MSQHGERFRLAAVGAAAHVVVAAALFTALPKAGSPADQSAGEAWPGAPPPGVVLASAGHLPGDPALVPGARAVDPAAWFRPDGRNQGTEGLASALATLALAGNHPLYVSDGWGRTGPGVHSDHHVLAVDSWAFDLAVLGVQEPTPATDLRATIGGYRFQLLWRVAGHFDHVHIGVRRTT